MNMRLAYLLFFFALFLSVYVGIYQKDPDPRPLDASAQTRSPAAQSSFAPPPQDRRGEARASTVSKGNEGLDLETFLKKYGEHLQKTEDKAGRVRSLTAWDQPTERWARSHRVSTFQANDRDQVLLRAREVTRDARRLMQIENPLEDPKITSVGQGARVEFTQTFQGTPLSQGGVSVVFGPAGELRALESDRLGTIEVLNRLPASTDLPGRTILWVTERTESGVQVRYARESFEMGIQTVRDVETGGVLFKRNRRKY